MKMPIDQTPAGFPAFSLFAPYPSTHIPTTASISARTLLPMIEQPNSFRSLPNDSAELRQRASKALPQTPAYGVA
jgi:hypothetical protein